MLRALEAIVSCALLLIGAPALAATAPANAAAATLRRQFRTEWQREMLEHPLEASVGGFHEYDGLWPNVSLTALALEHAQDLRALATLASIERRQLDPRDRFSYDLFKYRYKMRARDYDLETYLMPMNEPRVVKRVPHQISAYVVSSPTAGPFYAPFRHMPPTHAYPRHCTRHPTPMETSHRMPALRPRQSSPTAHGPLKTPGL